MHFQVISGGLRDVCTPSTFKFCKSIVLFYLSGQWEVREQSLEFRGKTRRASRKSCFLWSTDGSFWLWFICSRMKPGENLPWEIFLKFYVRFTYSVNIHWTNIVWTPTVGQAFECWSFNDLKQTNKQIITTTKTVDFIFQWREEVNHSYIMYLWCADKCPRLLSSLIPSTFLPWIPDQSCLSVQSLSYRWQEETSIEADTAPP